MQKYVYVRSPLKAAQLLNLGFSYIKAPFNTDSPMFIFSVDEKLMRILESQFSVNEDYIVRDGALLTF